jgi:hypothetical protein
MELFIEPLTLGLVHGPLGRREIGADQVLVDLREQRGVGVEPVENIRADRRPTALPRGFDPVPAAYQNVAMPAARLAPNHDGLQLSLLLAE